MKNNTVKLYIYFFSIKYWLLLNLCDIFKISHNLGWNEYYFKLMNILDIG